MKLGLYGINMGACVDPEVAASVAKAAEGAGFESAWTAEHVVLPDPQTPESPDPIGRRPHREPRERRRQGRERNEDEHGLPFA